MCCLQTLKTQEFRTKDFVCAQLIVLSIGNANIVRQTNRQTGIFISEIRLGLALTKTFLHIPLMGANPIGFK